ncbi:MAG: hypothetical protein HUU56_05745 [Bdellovibrionaceae bacterium]|nr:hypothetical protein [Pseudobdellovibrionaceae bacterium]
MYRRGKILKKFSVEKMLLISFLLFVDHLSFAAEFGAISSKTAGDNYEAGLKNSGLPINTKSAVPTTTTPPPRSVEPAPTASDTSVAAPVTTAASTAEPAAAVAGSAQNAKILTADGPTGLETLAELCSALLSPIAKGSLTPLCASLQEAAISCTGKFATTASACNTETSPSLISTLSQIQGLMGVAQGITNSCNNFSKAMNVAKMGMAAYTTTCGILQKTCDLSCSKSSAELTKFQSAVASVQAKLTACAGEVMSPMASLCSQDLMFLQGNIEPLVKKELATTGSTLVAKASVCKVDIATLLGMSIINLGTLAQSQAMAEQCKKDTAATKTPTAVDCTKDENKQKTECKVASTIVDCGLSANADKPICICKANPRIQGCSGVDTTLATNSKLSAGGSGGSSLNGATSGLTTAANTNSGSQFPGDLTKNNKNDGSGTGGLGAGGGASSAGLSGSSSGSAGNGDKLENNAATAKADILSGDSGGGGGGGGFRFPFSSNSAQKSQLRNLAQINAGKKMAGQDWKNQVTSNAGKSNFDKIKVRYNENKSTFLNR